MRTSSGQGRMIAALRGAERAVHAIIRGDAPTMSKDTLAQTINSARTFLIVGLVFLLMRSAPKAFAPPNGGRVLA